MSHTNYNKMYSKPEIEVEEVLEPEVSEEVVEEPVVEAEPEVIEEPVVEPVKEVVATVVGCTRLNVRKQPHPDADVLTIINASSEIICDPEPVGDYYKIHTASGIEGYCVKDYIKLK